MQSISMTFRILWQDGSNPGHNGSSTVKAKNGLVIQEWKIAFNSLMDCKCGPNPLLQEDRNRLSAEFITLCMNVDDITEKNKSQGTKPRQNTTQMYLVQTFYWRSYVSALQTCECFALKFLNEAVVEVGVASLNETSTERRSLSTN